MTVQESVSESQRQLREQGLRPVEIWVPDVSSEEFATEAHRQSLLVASSPTASDEMNFLEGTADHWPK